jgi:hypothetical protein
MMIEMPAENVTIEQKTAPGFFSRYQTLGAFVVLLCLAVYTMGANPFAGQTVAPLDILMSSRAWALQTAQKTVHTESTDIIDSQLPTWISLKEQIRSGEGALWWPYGTGGQPAVAEITNPAFLLFLMVKDNALAYYLVGLAKLVISGFGCFLLLRAFLPWIPSLWGGIVFMLCGFNSAWFFWEHVTTAMWLPWLFWATVRYLKSDNARRLPAITAASLLLILGSFPAVAAFGFYSFALFTILWNVHAAFGGSDRASVKAVEKIGLVVRKTAFPLAAVGIAFAIAAIALVPRIDFFSEIDLSYRTGMAFGDNRIFGAGTNFRGIRDLALFLFFEKPSQIERTAYIGIPVLILALAGIFAAFRASDRDLKRFTYIHAFLTVLTILMAYGLLPHQFISSIPVFHNNNWGRLIVIPLLGLSVLSSIGLNYFLSNAPGLLERFVKITPSAANGMILALALLLFAVQFYGQKRLFNNFNAVVPSAWMYPLTPSISYVKERLKPLQSVIADASFNMSGSLGAYRIPQWHAHTFKTDREKEVLSSVVHDPFPSPTSSYIDGDKIQFTSPLMDKLVIKYLLVNKGLVEREVMFKLPEVAQSLAPPLPDYAWKQHFDIPRDMTIGRIGFVFSTFGAEHAPADVRIALYRDGDKRPLAEAGLDKNAIADAKAAYFTLPGRVLLKKGGYTLVVSLVDYTGPGKLSALVADTPEHSGNYLAINGKRSGGSLKFGMVAYETRDMTAISKKWDLVAVEKNIAILENKRVTNSAYFVQSLDAKGEQVDFSGLDVAQPSSGLITIDYSRENAGWIVLPMRLDRGWKAYVDDRPVKYDAYLGMLPAIPVKGTGRIVFRYEPSSFKKGAILSAFGIFLYTIFIAYCVKYGRKRAPA